MHALASPLCGDADFYGLFRRRVPFLDVVLTDYTRSVVAESGSSRAAAQGLFTAGLVLGSHFAPVASEAEPCPSFGCMNDWLDRAEGQTAGELAQIAGMITAWSSEAAPLVDGPLTDVVLRAVVWRAPSEPFTMALTRIDAPISGPPLSSGEQNACFAAGLLAAGWALPTPCSCREAIGGKDIPVTAAERPQSLVRPARGPRVTRAMSLPKSRSLFHALARSVASGWARFMEWLW